MTKKVIAVVLCLVSALTLSLPVTAEAEAAVPTVQFLNHREHEGIKMFTNCSFTDDYAMYFNNNDMFYNVSDNNYEYGRWSKPMRSFLTENADGTLTRIETQSYNVHYRSASGYGYRDEETGEYLRPDWDKLQYTGENNIIVETYTSSAELLSTKTIPMALPIFGGFFSGSDYNFIVLGQENPDGLESAEVVRFQKYSKTWSLLGEQSVYGSNTTVPFDAGCLRMTESNGVLYVHTSHEMYSGHQANMTFAVDQATLAVKEQSHEVWNISTGYVSHSFNQFAATDGTYLYRADHGDAYPRSVVITRSPLSGSIKSVIHKEAFVIKQGSVGANDTGVCVGGFALGENNIILVGGTEDQENSQNFGNGIRNIFVSVTDKNLSETNNIMLTSYGADSKIRTYPPQLVKLDGKSFLVMWEELDTENDSVSVRTVYIDENGNRLSEINRSSVRLSDCQPILCSDSTVKWYVSTGSRTVLYSLPITKPEFEIICGDINGDGKVNSFDALTVLQLDVQLIDKPANYANGDANADGKVSTADATLMLRYDVALIDRLPYNQ